MCDSSVLMYSCLRCTRYLRAGSCDDPVWEAGVAVCVSIGVALIIAVAVVLYCCCRSEPIVEDKPTGTATAVSTTGVAMEYPTNGMTTLDIEQQTTETRSCNPCIVTVEEQL